MFAYPVRLRGALPARTPPWWRELGWRQPRELEARGFGWNGDLARHLGVAGR